MINYKQCSMWLRCRYESGFMCTLCCMVVKIHLMQISSVLIFWQKHMAVETDIFDCIDSYEHVFSYNGVLNF